MPGDRCPRRRGPSPGSMRARDRTGRTCFGADGSHYGFSWVNYCGSSGGVGYPERHMGFAGDRCALLPDGWSGRNGRYAMRGIGPAAHPVFFLRWPSLFAAPPRICRTAPEIGRGIAALSGRTGHADRIVAGRSGAAGMSGRGLRPRAGPATGISRLRGPIGMRSPFDRKMFNFNLTYIS